LGPGQCVSDAREAFGLTGLASQIASYLPSIILIGIVVGFYAIVLWTRSRRVVPIGQEGIVYEYGRLKATLPPGRHWIRPTAVFRLAPAGTSKRYRLGKMAVVTAEIQGRKTPGRVRVDSDEFPAFAVHRIGVGVSVGIVSFHPPNGVGVVEYRGIMAPFRPANSNPLR
jgi:hypothetical protein